MTINNIKLLHILAVALCLDILIPFALAPIYKGYNHLTKVMSVLGTHESPVNLIYNIWLVIFGLVMIFAGFNLYSRIANNYKALAMILLVALLIFAIGACVLSGIFPVGQTKSMDTLSSKIHGFGSAFGFMVMICSPLIAGIYFIKIRNIFDGILSLICLVLSLAFFVLFIMSDKQAFINTWIAYEGLWQRLNLTFMYIPLILLCFKVK